MGCDIHVFVEKRLDKSFSWQLDEHHVIEDKYIYDGNEIICLREVSATGRDYSLFSILATVRAYGELGSLNCRSARGLPSDMSELLVKNMMGPDWHSFSHMLLDEFTECILEAGYNLEDSTSTDAFYNWRSHPYNNRPPDYTTLIRYCREWLDMATAEAELLDTGYRPEVRIVFCFDN